jgi:RHS repeat-associated protein
MLIPGRHYNSEKYRFAFNGKESDPEWKGTTGAVYDYGFRIYDSRVAKFLSVDPLTKDYPWYTPYQFAGNTPIQAIDLDGLEEMKVFDILDDKGAVIKTVKYTDIESSFWSRKTKGYYITSDFQVHQYSDKQWDSDVPNDLASIIELNWEHAGTGGYIFTWKGVGQGGETRKGEGDIKTTEIGDIVGAALMSITAAGGTNKWQNFGAAFDYLADMIGVGYSLAEAKEKLSEELSTDDKNSESKSKEYDVSEHRKSDTLIEKYYNSIDDYPNNPNRYTKFKAGEKGTDQEIEISEEEYNQKSKKLYNY